MNSFKTKIERLLPEHDYPAGLIHPYWARKPLNIIETIICHYTKEGDTIADPFMGSGTSIVAAVKNKRNAIGCDLSPVSKLLVDSILGSAKDPIRLKKVLDLAVEDWINFSSFLYQTNDGKCVERETFFVEGNYVNGAFTLAFDEAKLKPLVNGNLKGKVEIVKEVEFINPVPINLSISPIDFSKIEFTENTRIAVHKGAKASDFFTNRNIVFINHVQNYIANNVTNDEETKFLKLFLSSMIPLLRLSDKKASSQWPYWRPKKELTSRNPIVAIKRRYKSFVDCLKWEEGELNTVDANAKVFQIPAELLPYKYQGKVDLIVTDPPYADHAPYLEYSDLYWSIVAGERTDALWDKEIVKTNAVGREKDSQNYESRMFDTISSVLSMLKDGGYFVFFYLDKNIHHWESIKAAIEQSGCITEDVIAIPKQRRSMKAVTSPGKTLDGDLIVICKKLGSNSKISLPKLAMKEVLLEIESIENSTYFERFGLFIKKYLTVEVLDFKDWSLKDISRVI
ncbi:DNA methyltransferase [Shewanella fidelis]|uniref:DNA methyltransferase n=1 Tax=Shewanella fidelis TaxID=173509 RepID=UPI00048D9E31|nr:DNA methyltransferase [Shewanella fidelis]